MINLLPSLEKRILQKEKHYKIVMILGIVFLSFLVCFCLILFSIKIFIAGQVQAEKILFEQTQKELGFSKTQDIERNIALANQNLFLLNSFYKNRTEITALLEEISGILPSGIYLTHFSLSFVPEPKKEKGKQEESEKKHKFQISISGFSPSREKLYELRQVLEAQEDFKEIYLPPFNWAKPTDVDFQISFKI